MNIKALIFMLAMSFSVHAENDFFYLPVTLTQNSHVVEFYVYNDKKDFVTCNLKMVVKLKNGDALGREMEIVHLKPEWTNGARFYSNHEDGLEIVEADAVAECYYL